MWILSKMRYSKCEFCEKWNFENVSFVINETMKRQILKKKKLIFWQIEGFCPSVASEASIFTIFPEFLIEFLKISEKHQIERKMRHFHGFFQHCALCQIILDKDKLYYLSFQISLKNQKVKFITSKIEISLSFRMKIHTMRMLSHDRFDRVGFFSVSLSSAYSGNAVPLMTGNWIDY